MTASSEHTRSKLVLAAIELFGEQGFHGPSLRRIGLAAGQKNTAAVHYHFTDREGVSRACLEFILDQLTASTVDAEQWLPRPAVQMSPLAVTLYEFYLPTLTLPERHPGWGRHGIRFLARVMHGESAMLSLHLEAFAQQDVTRFVETLSPLLPHLSAQTLRMRYDLSRLTLMSAMLGLDHDNTNALHALMDYVMGGLVASAS